jgi:hypothetical protein
VGDSLLCSACELRFPDTSDDLEAAAVDAAAASATAGALPLVTPGNQTITYHPGSMMMMAPNAAAAAAVNGGSSYHGMPGIMGLGGMCADPSMQLANAAANASRYAVANGGSGYGLVGMAGQQQQMQQQMQQMQSSLVRDDVGRSYVSLAGSDPNLRIPGIAMPQQQDAARSLSEPLPPMPDASAGMMNSCNASATNAAWLQLAAASHLPASQIMSSIRPPAQQQMQQQLMPGASNPAIDAALARMSAAPGMLNMSSGGAGSAAVDGMGGADRLSSNLAGMSLVDDSSTSSSCLTALSGDHQYLAALNVAAAAAASGRPLDIGSALQSPPKNSSNMENFLLLQQLQAQQQQQLAKLGSTASSMSCGLSPGSRQGSGNMYAAMASYQNGNVTAGQQMNGNWGMRLA